jgi:hypothetical protein
MSPLTSQKMSLLPLLLLLLHQRRLLAPHPAVVLSPRQPSPLPWAKLATTQALAR